MSNPTRTCAVCHTPASLNCAACHAIAYCGREHQRQDWAEHRKICCAYRIKKSPYGRYIVAERDIKAGDVIVSETPLVVGPSVILSGLQPSCPGCTRSIFTGSDKIFCPLCGWPVCDVKCPGLTDPAYHAAECEVLSKLKSPMVFHCMQALLPLRCLVLQKSDAKKWKILLEMAKEADDPPVERSKNESKVFLESAILDRLPTLAPEAIKDYSPETTNQVFSLLESNGITVRLPSTGYILVVCKVASLMDHSCLPNTKLLFNAPTDWRKSGNYGPCRVTIRAARDIPKGEPLSTIFHDAMDETFLRQFHLSRIKCVSCSCARCLDPTELGTHYSTLKCTTCAGWILPLDPTAILNCNWKCTGSCGKTLKARDVVLVIRDVIVEVNKLVYRERPPSAWDYEELLSKLEKVLHPHHRHCILAKSRLCKAYSVKEHYSYAMDFLSDADLERKAELCRDIMTVVLKPHMRVPTNTIFHECILQFIIVNIHIVNRMLDSGKWDLDRAELVKEECCELYLLLRRTCISSSEHFGPTEIQKLEEENVRRAFMKSFPIVYRLPMRAKNRQRDIMTFFRGLGDSFVCLLA